MHNSLFSLAFDAVGAYNQILCLIGALLFLGVGLLLLGNGLYWRLHAEKVAGQITGVRQKDGFYYLVYRYTLSTGQTIEATSDSGSSSPGNFRTGQQIPLLVFHNRPDQARNAGNYLFEILGVALTAPGAFLLYHACTAFPVTKMTFIVSAAMGVYVAIHLHRILIPKDKSIPLSQWKSAMLGRHKNEMQTLPIQSIETIQALPENQKKAAQQTTYKPQIRAVLLLFGPLLVAGGIYTGKQTLILAQQGLRTPGTVVSIASEWQNSANHSGYMYYPVVQFAPSNGASLQFKDKAGSNPPMYKFGDTVTVLYLPDSPQKSAIIDRGIWNWLAPILLTFMGIILFFGGLRMSKNAALIPFNS